MALVIAIVGIVQAGRTIRYYLDWRMRLAERQLGGKDPSLVKAIQELQAEIAALRHHEAEAVLSFDLTLHALDARMNTSSCAAWARASRNAPSSAPCLALPHGHRNRQSSGGRRMVIWCSVLGKDGTPNTESPRPHPRLLDRRTGFVIASRCPAGSGG